MTITKSLNAGLVAVSDRNGGFHIYMTAGTFDPSRWIRGTLRGQGWFASREDLEFAAEGDGRRLVKHSDYYQLQAA